MGLWDQGGLADTLTGAAPGTWGAVGGGEGVAAETKELWIHHFKAVRFFPAGLSWWKQLLTFSRPRPITLLPTQRRAPASILPSRWKWKKKVVLKLSSPPLLSIPAFPRALDRVDSSGACLWKEGRAMGCSQPLWGSGRNWITWSGLGGLGLGLHPPAPPILSD